MERAFEERVTPALRPSFLRLKETLLHYGSLAVAFSGGTDSTFLLYVAHQLMGKKVKAYTADTVYMVGAETKETIRFCRQHGIAHEVIRLPFPEAIKNNPPSRCYLCKQTIFSELKGLAARQGFQYLADGTNADDVLDYRPGRKALQELDVKSPLWEAGLTKDEIRKMGKPLGLPNWNLPPNACLLTRLPHDQDIDLTLLPLIEQAEKMVREAGFSQVRLRLRAHETSLEVGAEEVHRLDDAALRNRLFSRLRGLGFTHLTIDPEGYRTGNMNPKNK